MLKSISFKVPVLKPTDLMVEVRPRRVFSNGHTYHVNSISVNSDGETYLSADDLRINMWHLDITDRSFSILHVYPPVYSLTEKRKYKTKCSQSLLHFKLAYIFKTKTLHQLSEYGIKLFCSWTRLLSFICVPVTGLKAEGLVFQIA